MKKLVNDEDTDFNFALLEFDTMRFPRKQLIEDYTSVFANPTFSDTVIVAENVELSHIHAVLLNIFSLTISF